MNYCMLNNILLNVNFYSEEENQGTTMIPFFGFVLFIVSVALLVVAIVGFVSEWRDFRLFYDSSALEDKPDNSIKKKRLRKYTYISVAAVIIFIIGEIMLHYGG